MLKLNFNNYSSSCFSNHLGFRLAIVHCKWQNRRLLFKTGDGASRDAAASENSAAREERAREPEARVNERLRTFLFPPGKEREEFSFTIEDKTFKKFIYLLPILE